MIQIQGLKMFVQSERYRKAMNLPSETTEEYTFLAKGEYNVNYVFYHPIWKKKLVLRVNISSQMHLDEQIEYEYHALKLLEKSKRTPKAYYVDGSKTVCPYGILVMEYIEGHSMNYKTEFLEGAKVLADIHAISVEDDRCLLHPKNPLCAVLEECEIMIQVYNQSNLSDEKIKKYIAKLMEKAWKIAKDNQEEAPYECCINTELNSTNFLINKTQSVLVDWEKPIKGDPAQDLGHFLAPTTTFWKTDILLDKTEVDTFLDEYIKSVNQRFDVNGVYERTKSYIAVNCMRGITWCAMAWIQYQSEEKLIRNESTWKKLNAYLEIEFLEKIEQYI